MNEPPNVNSLKTFNDPIYGFITVHDPLIFKLLEHPHFQRLRRISQLGLTNLVYGGANHSRFQHALGAMNLMRSAIATLRAKGVDISLKEEQAAKAAILLHDVGHGPYSHALERTIVQGVHHETIGLQVMKDLNDSFSGELELAIQIYQDKYDKRFLHQLVSSQLDVDRLDYLKRDSFFTGVSEGVIGSERIIKMLTVRDGQLAVESKGIYSLEKFLVARRLMYWQVYLHKTVVSAEFLLMHILLKAKELAQNGVDLPASDQLKFFLMNKKEFQMEDAPEWLPMFLKLDDFDVMFSIKQWSENANPTLSHLCRRLINRRLLKVKSIDEPLSDQTMDELRTKAMSALGLPEEDSKYLVFQKTLKNRAYDSDTDRITIVEKDGSTRDLSEAANIFRFASMEADERKHFLYFPEEIRSAITVDK